MENKKSYKKGNKSASGDQSIADQVAESLKVGGKSIADAVADELRKPAPETKNLKSALNT